MQKGAIVTVNLGNLSSNTFMVESTEGDSVLVTHPLCQDIFMRVDKSKVEKTSANIKDSYERCIDFANKHNSYLDYNTKCDLEAISIYFALRRKLTPKQKQVLSSMCGSIAQAKMDNDLKYAVSFITKNHQLLDNFNLMWYNNFKTTLFSGHQKFTSKKQSDPVFNMAGYILAQLENPTAQTSK